MATPTPNLGLIMPDMSDEVDKSIPQLATSMSKIDAATGKLSDLTTADKSSLVSAISENSNGLVALKADNALKAYKTDIGMLRKIKTHVEFPTGFTWLDAPINIYKNELSEFYTDFDVANYAITGKTYYVNKTTGSNTNDGLTPTTALATIKAAAEKVDVDVVLVAGGTYYLTDGLIGYVLTRSMSIKAMVGEKVILSQRTPLTWTLTAGKANTYEATRSAVAGAWDVNFVDDNGDYAKYTLRASIDEVEANSGSYFAGGGKVYVHTLDNRVPTNSDLHVYVSTNNIIMEGDKTIYLEGLIVEGGGYPLRIVKTSSTAPRIYAKDCSFKYGSTANGVHIVGAEYAFFQSCIVGRSKDDGFNYHAILGTVPKSIEVNCTGRSNGTGLDSIDNGSTMHEGGKIIRVNGVYHANYGSNVGDIDTGTQSWNLGCVGFDSQATTEARYNSNFTAHVDAQMWLDGCVSYDSTNGITIQDNAIMHIRDSIIRGSETIEGSGQKLSY